MMVATLAFASVALVLSVLFIIRSLRATQPIFDGVNLAGSGSHGNIDSNDRLLCTVSHELRTPLTSIRGAIDLMSSGVIGDLPDEARSLLEIASKNSSRLLVLVNDLLDYQRIEGGHVELRRSLCSVPGIVTEARDSIEQVSRTRGVSVLVDADDVDMWVDRDRCLQVITNLLSNAVRHSPERGVVRLTASVVGGDVQFVVDDEGPGIPQDARAEVFEPFVQLGQSSVGSATSGLGLAICRSIVDQHGGSIRVERAECGGARFVALFPVNSCGRLVRNAS